MSILVGPQPISHWVDRFPPACSDVAFTSDLPDGTKCHVRGRTMDFPNPTVTHFVTFPAGESCVSYAPGVDKGGYWTNGEEGFHWESEQGFIGLTALGSSQLCDSLNPTFCAELNTLMASQFQVVPEGMNSQALAARDIVKYLAGTCSKVSQVGDQLKKIYAWRCTLDNRDDMPMPLFHLAVHDNEGGNGVVEYVDGELKFYEGTQGILTNDPVWPSQQDILQNYVTFTGEYQLTPIKVNGVMIKSNFVGNRFVGMPGSTSPIDRSVRLNLSVSQMTPPKTREEARLRIWDLIDNVKVIPGTEVVYVAGVRLDGYTRWCVNMDLDLGEIEWTSYGDRNIRQIKLSDYDFTPGAAKVSIPLASPGEIKVWEEESALAIAAALKAALGEAGPSSSSSPSSIVTTI